MNGHAGNGASSSALARPFQSSLLPDLAFACILVAMSLSKMRLSSQRRASSKRDKRCRMKHWMTVALSLHSLLQAASMNANCQNNKNKKKDGMTKVDIG